jgi:ABC-type amino acid transport substrate-binding protein
VKKSLSLLLVFMLVLSTIGCSKKDDTTFAPFEFEKAGEMAVKSDNTSVNGYKDLAGQTVAIKTGTEGTTFAESVSKECGFELKYFDESSSMYDEVKVGNSIACFEDYPVVGYAIAQGLELRIPLEKETGNSYGFAVFKGEDSELLDFLNKVL